MEVVDRQDSDTAVIDVSGRMVYGEPVRDLHDAVRRLLDQVRRTIVVDLKEVSCIDTAGLEALIASYVTCSRSGASLRLINPNSQVRKVLRITKLDAVLEGLLDQN